MSNQRFRGLASAILLAVCWAAATPFASAQAGDRESGELAVLGGVSWGAGTQAAVSGSAGAAFSRYGMALFDFSFMPMGNHTIQPWPAPASVQRSHLYDFAVDFHVRVPIGNRWEPYGIVGTGLLWNSLNQSSTNAQGVSVIRHYDQFNGALHTGGGVRYFVGRNWGVRSEFKVIVSKDVYTRLSLGCFFVLPSDWP
jgi:hypothetical protein